jgi:hypothetical protein
VVGAHENLPVRGEGSRLSWSEADSARATA